MATHKWRSVEDLRPQLNPLVVELGRMPTTRDLRERGLDRLTWGIYKFGGLASVAEQLGYPYISGKGPKRWRSVQDLRAHLEPIVNQLGRMPEAAILEQEGRHDLIGAIQKFGGHRTVANVLGYPANEKRAWGRVEDLRSDLDPIVARLGRMPNRDDLKNVGPIGLREAIRKFGGYYRVAVTLDYLYEGRKPWSTVEDLKPHLDPIVDELGRMPSKSELEASGRFDLTGAIGRFGGIRKVAEQLAYPYEGPGAEGLIEDLRADLDPIVARIGWMPNTSDLRALHCPDLVPRIKKLGGAKKVAMQLGYPQPARSTLEVEELRKVGEQIGVALRAERRPSVEQLRSELDPIVTKLGHMPGNLELQDLGLGGLRKRIQRFGGVRTVAELMGYPYLGTRSWANIEDLRTHLDPFVEKLGRMPTASELTAEGRVDLTGAIRTHGGFPKVAGALGYPHRERRSFQSVEDLRPHLDAIVQELGRMPSFDDLQDRRRLDLVHGLAKFGGVGQVAAELGYPYQERASWQSIEELRPHLDPIVTEMGRMPIQRELKARGRHDLIGAVQKFGGQSKVAKSLGYPYQGRQRWRTLEELREELDPIVAEIGRMPSQEELKDRGLDSGVHRFGGIREVATLLGYRYVGPKVWESVEDLRTHLDPIVAELGWMPGLLDLKERGRMDLAGAIHKFGGFPKVAEALGYSYAFTPALGRRARFQQLEKALQQLHRSQMLSAGQVMLILRHAGLLSMGHVAETLQRLQTPSGEGSNLAAELTLMDAIEIAAGEHTAEVGDDDAIADMSIDADEDPSDVDDILSSTLINTGSTAAENESSATPNELGLVRRIRETEVKELRGWSQVGNLIDPSPALIQLTVTRLKVAFYRFANEVRGSLKVPTTPPSPEQLEQLEVELWDAAFGEYGDLLDNDLVLEACDRYIGDLATSLLLPRHETVVVPRLYQLDGARFIAERVSSDQLPYGLLFDQPGMGKTLTTLWGLAAGGAKRIVIVAPLTVKQQVWTIETIHRAFPDLDAACFAASLEDALALSAEGPAVAVLHYEELRRLDDIKRLAAPRKDGSLPFDVLVLDEAHEVKERLSTGSSRGPTRTGVWLLRKGARACIGLTATPVVNELFEPVSLLHLAQGERTTDAGRRLQSRRLRDRVDVMEYLIADSLRRLKPDVLFEIPPREIRTRELVPDAELLERMRVFLSRGRRAVATQLAEYRRLVLEGKLDWIEGAVKANLAATTPEGLPDPKTLVLCYNVEGVSKAIYEHLTRDLGVERVLHIDGSTPQSEREELLRRFRAPADAEHGAAVLVGTVGTVGVGVTLFDPETTVTPHRVIFADLPFTWAEFEQGVDRLHRVGQKLPVQVDVPVVTFGEQLTRADGEPLESFDEWVWGWIKRKQLLSDQVLDAAFDVSEYKDSAVRKAISQALRAVEESGGAVIAPPPPEESPAAEHRRSVGRLRGVSRERAADAFREAGASERFLAANDASPSARLAQRLVRERLSRWLDRRSVVIDLGCGSNPLRDLPCDRVVGIDRHGVNGSLVGDSADTGLPSGEADFVVMSLSMWGTPEDRLAYLREAKRLLRPLGKLVVVEPVGTFGGLEAWQTGSARFGTVAGQLGMNLTEARAYAVDTGTTLVALVVDNSTAPAAENVDPDECVWNE